MTEDRQEAVVRKRITIPPGVIPRNAQAWLIGGIALVMVLVILFSGAKPPKEHASAPQVPTALEPSVQRIEEYRAHMDAQAKTLAQEQAELAKAKQAYAVQAVGAVPPTTALAPAYPATPPEKTWIESDKERRDYLSLFASNVALSRREETVTSAAEGASKTNTGTSVAADSPQVTKEKPAAKSVESGEKTYRIGEGTVIETVLTNRLDGSFSGPVNCMVTTPVYSEDRQHALIPRGSRVLGEVHKVEGFGQERLAVTFHRLVLPDGHSVSLDQFQGLSQIGETGLRDQVNHHYLQVFGVSLAIGAIAGFSQSNTRYGIDASAEDAYRQGVATSLSQSSLRILDRYLNVLPTFTIREGQRVKVYLSGDLHLPAYEPQGAKEEGL